MRFKAITVIFGAVAALSAPTKLGGPADAADAMPTPKPEVVRVPEFVPIVNFGEFVLATQAFAAQNPPDARIAAEAMSAKFAADLDAQKIELHKPMQEAAVEPGKAQSVIVTRPVVVAAVPPVPDPNGQSRKVADPVKVMTAYPAEHADAAPRKHKTDRKVASNGRPRLQKQFEPAMGLGMVIDSAEEAPPMSSLAQKKREVKTGSSINEW